VGIEVIWKGAQRIRILSRENREEWGVARGWGLE
jgi:hypothetical protein